MAEEVPTKGGNSATKNGLEQEEESTPFDPRAGLTEEQLALRTQLETFAMNYAQDDREKAWLST